MSRSLTESVEPFQRELLEGIGGRIVRRVEGGDAHEEQRAEQIDEEDQQVEADHRPHDELRAHRIVSPRLTLNSRSISMTKRMQASKQDEAHRPSRGPVEGLEEEVIDDRGEPKRLGPPRNCGAASAPARQHEHHRAARGDAGLGMGHHDVAGGCATRGRPRSRAASIWLWSRLSMAL